MSSTTAGWTFRLTAPDGRFVDFGNWSAEHVEGTPGEVELRWADNVFELELEAAELEAQALLVDATADKPTAEELVAETSEESSADGPAAESSSSSVIQRWRSVKRTESGSTSGWASVSR